MAIICSRGDGFEASYDLFIGNIVAEINLIFRQTHHPIVAVFGPEIKRSSGIILGSLQLRRGDFLVLQFVDFLPDGIKQNF